MSDDHLILKDSKSNPELIGGLTIEDERQAELTLLMLLEDMPQSERVPFLKENDISYEEFNRIYEKWFRVLERYRKDKKKLIYKCEVCNTPCTDFYSQEDEEGNKIILCCECAA